MRYAGVIAPLILSSALATLPVPLFGQGQSDPADDPLFGTWRLNLDKSTFRPGPAPKSQTRTYEKHRLGVQATVRTILADGRETTVRAIYEYDNEEYQVTGSGDVDSIRITRVNPYMHEATLRHAGREIGSFSRVISKDGTRMTVTLRRTTPMSVNVEVYEREGP